MKYLLVFTFIVATVVVGVERTFASTIPENNSQDLGGCNEFTFDATSSFDPDNQALTFHWDFGDGNTSKEPIITHRYATGGEYNVILSVQDSSGLHCDTAVSSQVVSANTLPIADAGPNHVCCLDTVSEFDGSQSYDADGDNLTYTWNFGDGATGDGAQVTHIYTTIGKYLVTLTVNDNSGTRCDTATDSFTAVVNATPTSIIKIR